MKAAASNARAVGTIHTVGVTGGIGSGKSAVCAVLEGLGVPVLSADRLALAIAADDGTVRRRILRTLGPEAYLSDGTYHRTYVARRIFADRSLQRRLEAILHPAVDKALRSRVRELDKAGHRWAGVEAALIYEAGLDAWLDAVIVVDAPEEVRIARVVERDHSTPTEALQRIKAQLSSAEKRRRADFVIVNDGTREELERNVGFIFNLLRSLREKG